MSIFSTVHGRSVGEGKQEIIQTVEAPDVKTEPAVQQFQADQQRLRVCLVMDLEFSRQKKSLISGFKSKWLLTVMISKFGSSTFSSLSKWKSKNKNEKHVYLLHPSFLAGSHMCNHVIWLGFGMNDCKYLLYIWIFPHRRHVMSLFPCILFFKLCLVGIFCTVPCKAWK